MKGLLLYVRQNSIQLVETVVMDDELALAFGAMFKLYARAQFFGQLFLQTADVGIRGLHRRRSAGVCEQAPHHALGFPYRYSLRRHLARRGALGGRLPRQERASIAHLQIALVEPALD